MWLNLASSEIQIIKRLLQKHGKKEGIQILKSIATFEEESEDAEAYREAAAKKCSECQLDIDGDAVVSEGSDPGAYVMAWLWVGHEDLPSPREWSPRGV